VDHIQKPNFSILIWNISNKS